MRVARATRWIVTLALFATAAGVHAADEGSFALEFLGLGVGARAAAMGSAYVAVAEDASAAYWNPAGLTGVEQYGFTSQHADMFQQGTQESALMRGLAQYNFVNVVVPFNQGKLGISWIRLGIDDVPRVTFDDVNGDGILGTFRDLNQNGVKDIGERYVDNPQIAETFTTSDNALLLSYARSLGSRVSVGGTAKIVRQSIIANRGNGFGADLGAIVRLHDNLRGGLVIQDAVGTRVKWDTPGRPTFSREANPRAGIAVRLPGGKLAALALAADVDLNRTTRLSEEGSESRLHAGAELTLLRTVSFRAGLDAGEFTAGAGFRIPVRDVTVHADYAFMTHPDLGDAQRLSLTGAF
jgi:hypothetical protein